MTKPSLVFMGTPEFARVILEKLYENSYPILGVFAQPDKPVGRGKKVQSPPVALFAKEKNLPLYQPARLKDSPELEKLTQLKPDYIIVAAYGKILGSSVLTAAKKEILNVHASLLPRHRGAAPINYALLKGDDKTGVAIMRVVKELDAGPVFLEKSLPITDEDTAITLFSKMADLGVDALVEALEKMEVEGLEPLIQDEALVTFSPKLTKEMGLIDWNRPAREIFNQIRGLLPWPTASTTLQGKTLKVLASRVLKSSSKSLPGTITHMAGAGWTVATGEGDLLVTEVQLEGKKRMPAYDLANGLRLATGLKLGV